MTPAKPRIERLDIAGYKSIRRATIELGPLNVLIGANGAGKSNLVSFFNLFRIAPDADTLGFVGRHGGPNSLLYLGAQNTTEISAAVTVRTAAGTGILRQKFLFHAPDGVLSSSSYEGPPRCAESICSSWRDRIAAYHINDTRINAQIRTDVYVEDNARLHPDGGNLAAMLYLYKNGFPHAYRRIRSTIRAIVPAFDDFVLEPQRLNSNNILLRWRQQGSDDYLFGPHQISDGSLRAMALITLLLQPSTDLPDLLIVDEPELGLHPVAVEIIAGLFRSVSVHTQVIVTTQSVAFLDQFSPDEIIVADAKQGASEFRRLDPDELKDWLEDYSIGELWEKNVVGGGPMA